MCEEPAEHQASVLRRLLHLHRATAHLQQHGIKVPDEFGPASEPVAGSGEGGPAVQGDAGAAAAAVDPLSLLRQLPLTAYDAYAARIDEAVAAGRAVCEADPATKRRWEEAVAALTGAQPVYAFCCSSGQCHPQAVASISNSGCGDAWFEVGVSATKLPMPLVRELAWLLLPAHSASLTPGQPCALAGTTGGQKRLPASMLSVTANIKAILTSL